MVKGDFIMGRALSNDLRARLIRCVERGMSARSAGKRLEIAASTATGIVKDWRERGCYKPLCGRAGRKSILENEKAFIAQMVGKYEDWTEDEYCAYLEQERGLRVHPTTVGRLIRKMGYRYKKNDDCRRTRTL